MNFIEKIAEKRKIKNTFKNEFLYAKTCCKGGYEELLNLEKSIKSFNANLANGSNDFLIRRYNAAVAETLSKFETFYSPFIKSLEILTEISEQNSKYVKKVALLKEYQNIINNKFINLYSYFLVAGKLPADDKQNLKQTFFKVIKATKIPVHTDENTKVDDNTNTDPTI